MIEKFRGNHPYPGSKKFAELGESMLLLDTRPMPAPDTVNLGFVSVSDSTAMWLSGADDLPPTVCPDLIPPGWQTTGEVLDFNIADIWVEAYLLEKDGTWLTTRT